MVHVPTYGSVHIYTRSTHVVLYTEKKMFWAGYIQLLLGQWYVWEDGISPLFAFVFILVSVRSELAGGWWGGFKLHSIWLHSIYTCSITSLGENFYMLVETFNVLQTIYKLCNMTLWILIGWFLIFMYMYFWYWGLYMYFLYYILRTDRFKIKSLFPIIW